MENRDLAFMGGVSVIGLTIMLSSVLMVLVETDWFTEDAATVAAWGILISLTGGLMLMFRGLGTDDALLEVWDWVQSAR